MSDGNYYSSGTQEDRDRYYAQQQQHQQQQWSQAPNPQAPQYDYQYANYQQPQSSSASGYPTQPSYPTQAPNPAYGTYPSYSTQQPNPAQSGYSSYSNTGYYPSTQGNYTYQPQDASQSQQYQQPTYPNHGRADSGHAASYQQYAHQQPTYQQTTTSNATEAQMPEPLDPNTRAQLHGRLIEGTPDRGWYETLDSSYRMRTGQEARQFFRKGRVFAMLYSEAMSETLARRGNENDAVTVVRFGQYVYSQIRRFVVISVKHGFVNACAISTYSQRGVLKPGCDPSEHTIVYTQGTSPTMISGEYEAGMTKEPIEIIPADSSVVISPYSRLRLGKTYPIEWNVKVKDIGQVHPEHVSKLLMYWRNEVDDDSD